MGLDLKALNDYSVWREHSPAEILAAVRAVGGWATVFPGDVPDFAHKVRNYFNYEPMTLSRFAEDFSREFLASVRRALKAAGLGDTIEEKNALSPHVYKDEFNRLWFQMSPGAALYHLEKHPSTVQLADPRKHMQSLTSVFKLISPDGTGGSAETIIRNPLNQRTKQMMFEVRHGRSAIGSENTPEPVHHLVVDQPSWKRGSYNYSETTDVGIAKHNRHDVKPHKKKPDAYVNPPSGLVPLALRHFPEL